jgi:hypothetical protein
VALRQNPRVVYRDLADGGVLLHLESGEYHSLNATGCEIWKLIDGQRTPGEIAGELRAKVDDAPADLDAVVSGFLRGLEERDLVVA